MENLIVLKGMTWDHPRGIDSLRGCTQDFAVVYPDIRIQWDARPLAEFEDTPIRELAQKYDLIAMDHPFIGDAVLEGALYPISDGLSRAELVDLATDSAGLSHQSYFWQDKQWAVAIDAACMVSAHRADLMPANLTPLVPETWRQIQELAAQIGRERILIPANPTHMMCTVFSLCEALDPSMDRRADGRPLWWPEVGIDGERLTSAIAELIAVLEVCALESTATDPITALERLSSSDEIVLVPLTFGYVSYALPRANGSQVTFSAAPRITDISTGSLIGGVGLAISSFTKHPAWAVELVRYVSKRGVQRGRYVAAGGQPGRLSAWMDGQVNRASNKFYANTLDTMSRSFLRSRNVGFPLFQRQGAYALHELVLNREKPVQIASVLVRLWRELVRS